MDLSVIIVTYNTCDISCRCIASLYKYNKGVEFEVTVVDNNSADSTADVITEKFPQVKVIRSDTNLGFAAGQNLGILKSTGKYVLILNSDIIFDSNVLKSLFEYCESHSSASIGAIGPQVKNDDGSIAVTGRRSSLSLFILFIGIFNRHFKIKRWLPSEIFLRKYFGFILAKFHDNYSSCDLEKDVEYVDGMCVLIPRDVLCDVGLFDEQFFFDFEIIDLCTRIIESGKRIVYCPDNSVTHLSHSSRSKVSSIIIETHRSELIYFAKYERNIFSSIRRFSLFVVVLRRALLTFSRILRLGDNNIDQTINIYTEIIKVCKEFDPEEVYERITKLEVGC